MMRRRQFLLRAFALVTGALTHTAWRTLPKHPEPRPGITAANVLKPEQLEDAKEVFAMVREIPHVVDGIRCPCGCADREGFYSLLSCFEGEGMAQDCRMCQGVARLAYRLNKDGKTLDEIRAAADRRYDR